MSDFNNISATVKTKFSGKAEHDKEDCFITAIICLKDERLLLLDYNNKKLKMFDKNYQIICEEIITFNGYGMTKVAESEIAVVGGESIYFYTVTCDSLIQQDKRFSLDAEGYGISYDKGLYAVACNIFDDDGHFLKICSATGQEIHRITSFKYRPSHLINLDSENGCLYVSPYGGGKFTSLSFEGHLLWEMDLDSCDIAALNHNLLVTSAEHNAIYLCAKDGTYRKILMQDKEHSYRVWYIAFSPETKQIFVSHWWKCPERNNITIIQLSF